MSGIGTLGDVEQETLSVNFDVRSSVALDDVQPVPRAPDVVRLAGHHLADRLALGRPQLLLVLLDPWESVYYREAHLIVVELLGGGNPHPTHGRIDADVEVLDVLVDDIDVNACNG
jgi:hypothetical protein